jgi:LytS/YehU family sensor histidine kinase
LFALNKGVYELYFRKHNSLETKQYKVIKLFVSSPWYNSNWAFFLYFILFILLGYVISRNYFKNKQRNLKNELILMESELKALRAQINPHYLSNSLVSLQQLILKDNKLQAIEVLSRYGKVMRSILNNSEHPFVSLNTEISTLKEYIELEALLLFENSEFRIHYDKIDNELLQSIQIPSMLIQPYVENAIIHGLIPKNRSPYQLSISFEFNERLICTIQDNGVGRSPKVQNTKKISKGNQNVENRMKLYGKLLQQTMSVEIVDLKNELNESEGTKVVIVLPHGLIEKKTNK